MEGFRTIHGLQKWRKPETFPSLLQTFPVLKNYILDATMAQRKIERMALEIAERNTDAAHIVLAGIPDNGAVIAAKLLPLLQQFYKGTISSITVSLDKKHPEEVTVTPQMNFNDVVVVLVDDVANRGKTMTYALKPFLAFYPQKIQTLVLVERTHKAFPVQPDYVGLSIATTLQEHIYVEVAGNEVTGAWME
jgi:pyrimidine operon attenuation protein / uracil phosphoribosyltransferase